ncbi:transmembrane fragile-X-F protein [Vibrio phage 141O35-1]|nr:transmembrane fragile-X-F protein [Vibrio phage 141O35-1]CAH9015942.1 transmembrane fragile-X-F protein [Vibrio phage 141E35-1]
MSGKSNQSAGIGFFGVLTILFIGLKLASVINWSWWWVLAPMWLPVTAAVGILLLMLIVKTLYQLAKR